MVDRFPHMNGTDFPGLPDDSNFFDNRFDYKKYDKTQMRIGICSVPWDVGLIHVGNAQIGGLGNVVYFESKEARDAYFDDIGGYVFDTKYREYHSDGSIQIPLPYEKAVLYNYVWVEYTRLPTDYSEYGKDRFFFFIRECESLSPNDSKVTILRDTWQTFVYDIDISYMMLEQGHAPMSIVDADTYLANPIDNNSWLLAEDVNFGNSYKRKYHNSIVLNTEDIKAVIVTTANLTSNWDDKTPDGHVVVDGNPSYYAYALDPGSLAAFLSAVDAQCPQFSQTVQGVFFVSSRLVRLLNTVTFCGYELARLEQKTSNINLADLTKAAFGYGEDYANLAKLYTYPYAFLEIADDSGEVTQIKIEETSGNLSLIVTTSLAYPWIAIDGRLTGVGEGSTSIEFYNVDAHTFDFQGSWYDHLHRWEVPVFGITQSAAIVDAYSHKFEREQRERELDTALSNATRSANTSYDNAVNNARTGFTNAVASADTGKLNADAADNAAYSNSVASADTAKTNADAADNTAYSNAVASADTGKLNADAADNAAYSNAVASADTAKTNADAADNTAYSNAIDSANVQNSNTLASASTSRNASVASANTAKTNADASASTAKTNATNSASTAKTNATNSATTARDNEKLNSAQVKSDGDAQAETNKTNTKNANDTARTNADNIAQGVYSNAVNDAQANRKKYDNERRLVQEQVEYLAEDGEPFPNYTGYIGRLAWAAREKIGDDTDSDSHLQWYVSGQEIYNTAISSVVNSIGGSASTIAGSALAGMAAGPGGAGIGAVSGLTTSAVNLAASSISLPLLISTQEDIVNKTLETITDKARHYNDYSSTVTGIEIEKVQRFYNIDQLWLGLNAELAEKTAKHDAKRTRDEEQLAAKNTRDVGNANADRTYDTQTTINEEDKNTADTIADNAYNTAIANAGNDYNTATTNAGNTYNATTVAASNTKNTAIANADNALSTAQANAGREYTKDKAVAQRSRDTGLLSNSRTRNTAVANAERSRDTGLQSNSRTRNTAVANAERSRDTGLQSNSRTRNTAVANAERSRDVGLQSNSRTRNTAVANATRTRDASIENAQRSKNTDLANAQDSYDTGIAGIQAEIDQAALAAPVKYGEFANGETSATRPQGLFCNIVTQSKDAIEQTGDYWLRFGYKVNRSWRFTGFNLMPHFTYWKASDMWIAGNNVPDAYLDEIRFYLLGGVCVWRNPEDIGRISIYENMR